MDKFESEKSKFLERATAYTLCCTPFYNDEQAKLKNVRSALSNLDSNNITITDIKNLEDQTSIYLEQLKRKLNDRAINAHVLKYKFSTFKPTEKNILKSDICNNICHNHIEWMKGDCPFADIYNECTKMGAQMKSCKELYIKKQK